MRKNHALVHFKIKNLFLFSLFLIFSMSINGQIQRNSNTKVSIDWDVCKYYPAPQTHISKISVPDYIAQKMSRGGGNCATFIVSYNGFTPQAEAAFQFAVDIWSNSIESTIPIRVSADFGPLDPGVLGGAGPTGFIPLFGPGIPPSTVFPIALAEKLLGEEIPDGPSTTSVDISATFSSTANFYFGLDGNTPGGQVDFVSVVLHELGHGLGILGFGRTDDPDAPTEGVLRNNGFVNVWDNFIENGTPDAIKSFTDPSADLLLEITGNDLFSNSPISTAQNGGIKPSTYAPAIYTQGSSYSHWDEFTYPAGHANSLMTPSIAPGEAIHDPGLVTLGFMEDMGWSICGGSLSVTNFKRNTIDLSPNPFRSSFNIQLEHNTTDDYSVGIHDINGRQILKINETAKNGSITISNLDQLENALYFVKIINKTTGSSIIKKIIKN